MILQTGSCFININYLIKWHIEYNEFEKDFDLIGISENGEEITWAFLWMIEQDEEEKAMAFILSHLHGAIASDEKIINLEYLFSMYRS